MDEKVTSAETKDDWDDDDRVGARAEKLVTWRTHGKGRGQDTVSSGEYGSG